MSDDEGTPFPPPCRPIGVERRFMPKDRGEDAKVRYDIKKSWQYWDMVHTWWRGARNNFSEDVCYYCNGHCHAHRGDPTAINRHYQRENMEMEADA